MEYTLKPSWEVQGVGQWAGQADRQQSGPWAYRNLPLPQTSTHAPPASPDRALSGVRGHGLDLGEENVHSVFYHLGLFNGRPTLLSALPFITPTSRP